MDQLRHDRGLGLWLCGPIVAGLGSFLFMIVRARAANLGVGKEAGCAAMPIGLF